MTGPLLGYFKNGAPVYDRLKSHIHTEYEQVFEYIDKVLPLVEPPTIDKITFHHSEDFGEIIGESICVSTIDDDEIIFAQRKNRAGLTRFVKNRDLRPTSVFTVVFKRDQRSKTEQYILVTAYVGEKAPEEPWDKFATQASIDFWNTHALVWGSMPVLPGTETIECPW